MISAARSKPFLPFLLLSLFLPALLFSRPSQAATCDGFYASNFTLAQGKLNPAVPNRAKPAKGTRIEEPSFKTCLFRATDHRTEPSSYYLRNDYSRRQAFNANSTYFLVYSNNGSWTLYNANTRARVRTLTPLAGDAEPQWHPTDPNVLYYLPINGGTKLLKVDVRNNQSSTVVDFRGKLPSWASSAAHIWTNSEGSPSANGRYWGFVVYNSGWDVLGYIVWDLQQNKLVGSRQSSGGVDNGSISASGRWFVVSGNGVWAWSADFTKKKKIDAYGGVHSDLAIGPQGNDYFVSVDYESNDGEVYFVNLDSCPSVAASATNAPECPRTTLFAQYPTGGWASMHFSGKAFNKRGWVLISTYDTQTNRGTMPWFEDKIFAVELKASPKIYPLAFTRRVAPNDRYGQTGADAYWTEPHASVNRDFTRIAFNTNWGNSAGADIDVYMIELKANALGGAAPPSTVPKMSTNLPPYQGEGGQSAAIRPASSFAQPEAVSIGCTVCVHLKKAGSALTGFAGDFWRAPAVEQARSAMAALATSMWHGARQWLQAAADEMDLGSDDAAASEVASQVESGATEAASGKSNGQGRSANVAADRIVATDCGGESNAECRTKRVALR